MKRWQIFMLVAAVIAVGAYFYYYRGFRFSGFHFGSGAGGNSADARPVRIDWQTINRPDVGFRVEMPADAKETQVPAYNEAGTPEPVKMLYSNPDADIVFAVTWADNPPVARVNHRLADLTLDQARDGMMARTQTTKVRENKGTTGGYPSLDLTAKNTEGGYLDARFILINDRLYTLMAMYPSMNARREQDVVRFQNSFTTLHPDTALPQHSPNGT